MAQTPDYRQMTKIQLTALARRKKIPVKAGLLKEELVKALKKGLRKIEAQKKSKPKAAAKKKTATTSKTRTARKTSKAAAALFDGGSALPGSKTPVPESWTSPRGTRLFKPPSSRSR